MYKREIMDRAEGGFKDAEDAYDYLSRLHRENADLKRENLALVQAHNDVVARSNGLQETLDIVSEKCRKLEEELESFKAILARGRRALGVPTFHDLTGMLK